MPAPDSPRPLPPVPPSEARPGTVVLSDEPSQTEAAGRALGARLGPGAIVSLSGPLGCGKTVFVKGMARALGVEDTVTSPSFLIVQEYEGRLPLYHLDLYRIGGPAEVEDLGFREIVASGGVAAIEWGERAARLLGSERHLAVSFRLGPGSRREIRIEERP